MTHYARLDVSMNTTFICIVNEKGRIVKELEAASMPESIDNFLSGTGLKIEKLDPENGCLTHYLKKGLKTKGYDVVAMESHKMAAILATIINKADKNDARGIAEALRVGHYKECVHRRDESVEIRTILHGRRTAVEPKFRYNKSVSHKVYVLGKHVLFADLDAIHIFNHKLEYQLSRHNDMTIIDKYKTDDYLSSFDLEGKYLIIENQNGAFKKSWVRAHKIFVYDLFASAGVQLDKKD